MIEYLLIIMVQFGISGQMIIEHYNTQLACEAHKFAVVQAMTPDGMKHMVIGCVGVSWPTPAPQDPAPQDKVKP